MFDAIVEPIEEDRVSRYRIRRDGSQLTYAQVLNAWRNDQVFRSYFTTLLADSPFSAYRWETPPVSRNTMERPFEFVLLSAPAFCSRRTDTVTFDNYFTDDDSDQGVVAFASLRGDARLIVPSPRTDNGAYGHLAAFLRSAPKSQIDALWRKVALTVSDQINDCPVWLSTAGGGVAWLHVRLDSRPKYYGYAPYRDTP